MENFNLNYIWAALVINFLLVYLVPRLIKKPTKIQVVDDVVLFLNSQKGFLLASSIVITIVVYGSHYWVASSEGGGNPETMDTAKDW